MKSPRKPKRTPSKRRGAPTRKERKPVKASRGVAAPRQGAAVFILTKDPAVGRVALAVAKGAVVVRTLDEAVRAIATGARAGLVDGGVGAEGAAYETLRKIRVRSPIRLALLHPEGPRVDPAVHALARFAGAESILTSPPKRAELTAFLKPKGTSPLDEEALLQREQDAARGGVFEDRVLHDLKSPNDPAFLDAVCDPETRLYSSSYAAHAFDLEYKRAQRFALPLSIAIVGFEGEASREVLLDLAGIFLNEIRDTDMLARFDVNTFFFVLPNTLPEGARAMLERIAARVTQRGLRDLVGDPIELASGVAAADLGGKETREAFFLRARRACEVARSKSVAAVIA